MVIVECPSISDTVLRPAPPASAKVAAPWRRSCRWTGGRPAFHASRSQGRLTYAELVENLYRGHADNSVGKTSRPSCATT
jgi:hypothetical protein